MRKLARSEGRRYCSATALTYQAERMPENLRLHVSTKCSSGHNQYCLYIVYTYR